jgi:DNA repair protein SbcC/Rad50
MSTLKLKVQRYRRFTDLQVIAFQSGLTIISGSNGAGKSTLVEAMLFALFGTKRGLGVSEIRPDKTRGEPHVECELLIDDQVITIVREGNTAEVAINGVIQVMRGPFSAKSANERLAALLGGLTREQFESSYIALQGDTAGLVEYKARDRRLLIEKILQLEVLGRALDLQITHSDVAKNQVVAQGNVICNNELPLDKEPQEYIENFQSARVLHTRAQHAQSFQAFIIQTIVDRRKKQYDVELLVTSARASMSALQRQHHDHLDTLERANKTFQQHEENQKNYNKLQESIAGVDGKLTLVDQEIRKFQDAIKEAERCVDASVEYARLLKEKDDLEKRHAFIPWVKKCYDDFVLVETRLGALDSKLADLADIDEELCLARELEAQCKLRRDELNSNNPVAAEYASCQKQESRLEHEELQNRQALVQLTNGTNDARCPTCNQYLSEHVAEDRIHHLTTWLNEMLPPLQEELQRQKRSIDEQKEQWEKAKSQAENEYIQAQKSTVAVEKKVLTRDGLCQQRADLHADFLTKQRAWQELEEDTPDPQEDVTLIGKLKELIASLKTLKAQADIYDRKSLFQQSRDEKVQEQIDLEREKQVLLKQQSTLGYNAESYQTAKDLVEQLRARDAELREQLHNAELNLQSLQGELRQAQKTIETLEEQHNRFCTYVQEYYRQEHLRQHLENFKKHFFEANTGEVMRRATRLLMHAVTDQSILGIKFDKDEFQYLDASNSAYPISRLSGGEKALVGLCLRIALAEQAQAIARTGRVKFLILDEVLSSLDDERCDAVQRIFADVQKRGIFEHIIMITHLDSVKQGWQANGLVVQKVDGKTSTVVSVSPGEVPLDLAERIEV